MILKFSKNEQESNPTSTVWHDFKKQQVDHPTPKKDLLQNCFIIENDMVLVVKKFYVDFLSSDLMPIKFYSVKAIIDKNIEHLNCCTVDFKDGFLISCVLNDKADPDDYGSVFAG